MPHYFIIALSPLDLCLAFLLDKTSFNTTATLEERTPLARHTRGGGYPGFQILVPPLGPADASPAGTNLEDRPGQ